MVGVSLSSHLSIKSRVNLTGFSFNCRKFVIIAFVAVLSSALSQDLSFDCEFILTSYDEYICVLENIEVTDRDQNVTFGGTHATNKTNEDVEIVIVKNSTTPFVIPQIFDVFPNTNELEIDGSGLLSIEIPVSANLIAFLLYGNNISRIENGTFRNQNDLQFLYLVAARIEFIEPNAFEGLENLLSLALIGNEIESLPAGVFDSLTNVHYIDLENNFLTTIDDRTFAQNRELVSLYLEFNRINEISSNFADNFRESIFLINLTGNLCVDQSFYVNTDVLWNTMRLALDTCFTNFNNGTRVTRQLTLEFSGPLSIFDERGNLIARV